jgi:hypothetical protein
VPLKLQLGGVWSNELLQPWWCLDESTSLAHDMGGVRANTLKVKSHMIDMKFLGLRNMCLDLNYELGFKVGKLGF